MMHTWSIARMAEALRAREISSVELTQHFLDRIERFNPELNAILQTDVEGALRSAEQADQRLAAEPMGKASGERSAEQASATRTASTRTAAVDANALGPLTGIPLIHKDIFCTTGLRTTCGSRMLEHYESPFDATVVAKLKASGSVILGKANMDEFAMGSSNENSYFGPVANPWDRTRVPGGSSGGSAAVVAAGLAPMATGTDTGGSIRQPAALCGITGIKPTYGRVSRYGMIAFASSLDQGGPLARSAEDCAILLGEMAGFDARDSTSSELPVPDYAALLQGDVKGLRIGVPEEYFGSGLDGGVADRVNEALEQLQQDGATLVSLSLPNQHLCIPAYYVVAPAEASSNLSRYDGVRFGHRCDEPADLEDLYLRSRSEGFGAEVKRRILIGTYALSAGYYDAYYRRAQQVRRLITDDFQRAFETVDVIAGPTTPTPAFAQGTKLTDPVAMYLNDLYTVSANLSGLPALSMPCGFADGLPVGVQLMGKPFDEARLLKTAHRFQQMTDWHRQRPADFD